MLDPLRTTRDPILASFEVMPYVAAQQAFDAGMPTGLRWYSRAHFLDTLPDEAVDCFVDRAAALEGMYTMVYLEVMGGAVSRIAADTAAFPHRRAAYGLHILSGWTAPDEDAEIMLWAREFHDAMAPFANGGVYVNLLDRDEPDRVADAYGANLARLRRVKSEWDPGNLFRVNQNIAPSS